MKSDAKIDTSKLKNIKTLQFGTNADNVNFQDDTLDKSILIKVLKEELDLEAGQPRLFNSSLQVMFGKQQEILSKGHQINFNNIKSSIGDWEFPEDQSHRIRHVSSDQVSLLKRPPIEVDPGFFFEGDWDLNTRSFGFGLGTFIQPNRTLKGYFQKGRLVYGRIVNSFDD